MAKAPLKARLRNAKTGTDERVRALAERAQKERALHPSVRAAYAVVEANRRTAASLLAGGLAYRLFLWGLPFALFTSSLFQLLADASDRTSSDLAKELGMGAAMTKTVGSAAADAGRGSVALLLIGLFLMILAARSVWKALYVASRVAWGIPGEKTPGQIMPTLVVAGALSGFVVASGAARYLFGAGFVLDIIVTFLVVIAAAAAFVWAGMRLPHEEGTPWLHFVPGALVIAVGMELLRWVTSIYLAGRLDRADDLYGALGLAAVFMAYLYLVGTLVIMWLIVNAEWHRAHVQPDAPSPAS